MNAQRSPWLLLCSLTVACATISGPELDQANEAACIVTSEHHGLLTTNSWRVTWDSATRIKSQHASEAADSPVVLAWRYDAQGREVAYGGFGTDTYSNFQYDTRFDEHGNVEDHHGSYPTMPSLQLPPSSADAYTGKAYANEYGAEGELIASTSMPYGPNLSEKISTHSTFRRDAQGRCERIEIKGEGDIHNAIETRSYDQAGRLAKRLVQYEVEMGRSRRCSTHETIYEYDGQGRITRSTNRCEGSEGAPFHVETHVYAPDGSETVELLNYETDVVNDSEIIAGKLFRFARSKESRTAGCALIEAQITQPDLACHPR